MPTTRPVAIEPMRSVERPLGLWLAGAREPNA
jgi:hypothetical protein